VPVASTGEQPTSLGYRTAGLDRHKQAICTLHSQFAYAIVLIILQSSSILAFFSRGNVKKSREIPFKVITQHTRSHYAFSSTQQGDLFQQTHRKETRQGDSRLSICRCSDAHPSPRHKLGLAPSTSSTAQWRQMCCLIMICKLHIDPDS
jgi:hypothetical protein